MKQYIVKLSLASDQGNVHFNILSFKDNISDAVKEACERIMNVEKCPFCAIKKIVATEKKAGR